MLDMKQILSVMGKTGPEVGFNGKEITFMAPAPTSDDCDYQSVVNQPDDDVGNRLAAASDNIQSMIERLKAAKAEGMEIDGMMEYVTEELNRLAGKIEDEITCKQQESGCSNQLDNEQVFISIPMRGQQ